MHFLELIHIPLPRRMSLLLAQLTGTHLLPGCLPATPLQLDNAALIDWDIYGYIWIFVFLGYIYIYVPEKVVCATAGLYKSKFGSGVCWWGGTKHSSDLNLSNN